MRKKITITFIIILLLSILAGLILITNRNFESLLGTNKNNITKVFILNGHDGSNIVIKDKSKIKGVMDLFDNRTYHLLTNHKRASGFIFSINFYNGNNIVLSLCGGPQEFSINNHF